MNGHLRLKPVTIAFVIVVAIVFFFAGHSVGTQQLAAAQIAPKPASSVVKGHDGDPVGGDVFFSKSAKSVFKFTGGKWTNVTGVSSYQSVQVHYIDASPVPICPSPMSGIYSCVPGKPRSLPTTCPTGAQCLYFQNMPAWLESQNKKNGNHPVYHGPHQTTTDVQIILQ